MSRTGRRVAFIEEAGCVGCTLCIQACPYDAIVGAPRQMHTVVAEYCTGCDLCVPACPADCMSMRTAAGPAAVWDRKRSGAARERLRARMEREKADHADRLSSAPLTGDSGAQAAMQAAIAAAFDRARARRARGTS